jgi:hypothetical protein
VSRLGGDEWFLPSTECRTAQGCRRARPAVDLSAPDRCHARPVSRLVSPDTRDTDLASHATRGGGGVDVLDLGRDDRSENQDEAVGMYDGSFGFRLRPTSPEDGVRHVHIDPGASSMIAEHCRR